MNTMLSDEEFKQLHDLFNILKPFQEVTKLLQSKDQKVMNLKAVREIFDEVIKKHPNLSTYLSAQAEIVHDPIFESAMVKIVQKVPIKNS